MDEMISAHGGSAGEAADARPSPIDESRGKVARNVLHLVSGQVATTALSIVLNSQLGRWLGAGDFGLYYFLLTSTAFANVFVEWGQGIVLVRDVARRPDRTPWLLGSAAAIRVAISIPAAFAAALVFWLLDYDLRTVGLMALIVLAWIPTAMLQLLGLVFRGHERMDIDARATVLSKVVHVATVVAALNLGGRLVAVVLSLGASGAAALAWSFRRLRTIERRLPKVEVSTVRQLLADGGPVLFIGVLGQAQLYVETLILSSMTAQEVLGWHGAARSIMTTLIMPAPILASALLPSLSRVVDDPLALRRELAGPLRIILIFGVCATGGTCLFAGVATGLIYGSDAFAPSSTLLALMGPALSLLYVNILIAPIVVLKGRTTAIVVLRIVVIGIMAALALWWIPLADERWSNGAIGAVAVATLAELLLLVGFISLMPRNTIAKSVWFDLLRAVLCAVVGAGVVVVGPPSPFLEIPLYLTIFGAVAFGTRLVGRDDLEMLRGVFRRRLRQAG